MEQNERDQGGNGRAAKADPVSPPSNRSQLIRPGLIFVGVALIAAIGLTLAARKPPISAPVGPSPVLAPFEVKIDTTVSGGAFPVVHGRTNLPDGAALTLVIDGCTPNNGSWASCPTSSTSPVVAHPSDGQNQWPGAPRTDGEAPGGWFEHLTVKGGQFVSHPWFRGNREGLFEGTYVILIMLEGVTDKEFSYVHFFDVDTISPTVLPEAGGGPSSSEVSSGPDGTFVGGVLISNNCPPRPLPSGPLASPGLSDVPNNRRAFEGETDAEMFDRHKREAIAEFNLPCERDFQRRFDAALEAGRRADLLAHSNRVLESGHEYTTKIGESYHYEGMVNGEGMLLLRQTEAEIVFAEVAKLDRDIYGRNGNFYRCELSDGSCVEHISTSGIQTDVPTQNATKASVVRDARGGRLVVFSNPAPLLAGAPW